MLLNLFESGFSKESIISLLLFLPVLLISLTVHEYCHGYAAYKCGDNTAQWHGRLTLNPFKHLDPLGTIMMLTVGFGFARPVPINPRNFRHYKRDLCIVSVAGPLSNVFLAFIGLILYYSVAVVVEFNEPAIVSNEFLAKFFVLWVEFITSFILANTTLAVFNMIPIPPLDGSRIISVLLPLKVQIFFEKYERIIMFVVFILIWRGSLDGIINFFGEKLLSVLDLAVSIPFNFFINLR